jgi:hypothetical protein
LEQKQLLSKYILSSIDSGIELKIFLNEELGRVKNVLKKSIEFEKNIKEDKEMVEKTNEVLNLLESFRERQEIDNRIEI